MIETVEALQYWMCTYNIEVEGVELVLRFSCPKNKERFRYALQRDLFGPQQIQSIRELKILGTPIFLELK